MANVWNKWQKKSKKSAYEISTETGIPEQKVKEIINGERSVPTNLVDNLKKTLEEPTSKVKKTLNKIEIYNFFKKNSMQDLKEKFGFGSVRDIANELRISPSTLYNVWDFDYPTSYSTLKKVYDFFNNELNIQVNRKKTRQSRSVRTTLKKEDLTQEELSWYENTNLRELRGNKSPKMLLSELGFNEGYYVVLNYCENHNLGTGSFNNWFIVRQLYNYYNNKPLVSFLKEKKKPQSLKPKKHTIYIAKSQLSLEELEWYANSDLKKLRYEKGVSAFKLVEKIGFYRTYVSVYYRAESKRLGGKFNNWFIVRQLYNFYHDLPLLETYPKEEEIELLDITPMVKDNKPLMVENDETELLEEENIENLDVEPVEEETTIEGTILDVAPDSTTSNLDISKLENNWEQRCIELESELKRYRWLIDQLMNGDK